MAPNMRYRCSVAVLWAVACLAASEPLRAAPTEMDVSLGQPRMTFTSTGPELTRAMFVSADSALLHAEVSSLYCEELPGAYTGSTSAGCNRASLAAHTPGGASAQSATLTLKLPRVYEGAPYLDLSLRSWRAGSMLQGTTRGTELDAEVTQAFGRLELTAGMSRPISHEISAQWQSTWFGVSMRFAPRVQLRLLADTSREASSGARDTRYSMVATRIISTNLRANVYVTRSLDDAVRPWTLGSALVWNY